jgi:hypothetical protein
MDQKLEFLIRDLEVAAPQRLQVHTGASSVAAVLPVIQSAAVMKIREELHHGGVGTSCPSEP